MKAGQHGSRAFPSTGVPTGVPSARLTELDAGVGVVEDFIGTLQDNGQDAAVGPEGNDECPSLTHSTTQSPGALDAFW